jgi:hypothetical protein
LELKVCNTLPTNGEWIVTKKTKKKTKTAKKRARVLWTRADVAELRRHSKAKTPVVKLEKIFKRAGANLRSKAYTLGLSLGHQRQATR